jgi:hypothetical protein
MNDPKNLVPLEANVNKAKYHYEKGHKLSEKTEPFVPAVKEHFKENAKGLVDTINDVDRASRAKGEAPGVRPFTVKTKRWIFDIL